MRFPTGSHDAPELSQGCISVGTGRWSSGAAEARLRRGCKRRFPEQPHGDPFPPSRSRVGKVGGGGAWRVCSNGARILQPRAMLCATMCPQFTSALEGRNSRWQARPSRWGASGWALSGCSGFGDRVPRALARAGGRDAPSRRGLACAAKWTAEGAFQLLSPIGRAEGMPVPLGFRGPGTPEILPEFGASPKAQTRASQVPGEGPLDISREQAHR